MNSPTPTVHPHLPRFAQAITGVLCLEGVAFQDRWVLVAALGFVVLGRFAPRWSPVNRLFRLFARPASELEPAAPVRFSQMIAIVMLGVAITLLFTGVPLAGWIVAGAVGVIALFSAVSGICVGCEMYRLLMLRGGAEDDVRGPLGLAGAGPWLVVVTAPGCTRCEPVARQLEDLSSGGPVIRVDLTTTPAATRLPVRSVPAVLSIGRDGRIRRALAGRLDTRELQDIAATVAA